MVIIYIIIKSGLTSTYTGCSESSGRNASEQVSRTSGLTLKQYLCASLPTCSRFLGLKFTIAHILVYVLVCDVFSSICVIRSQLFRNASNEMLLCFPPRKWNSYLKSPALIGFLWWWYCGHTRYASLGSNIAG